jgi:hypothetical protein
MIVFDALSIDALSNLAVVGRVTTSGLTNLIAVFAFLTVAVFCAAWIGIATIDIGADQVSLAAIDRGHLATSIGTTGNFHRAAIDTTRTIVSQGCSLTKIGDHVGTASICIAAGNLCRTAILTTSAIFSQGKPLTLSQGDVGTVSVHVTASLGCRWLAAGIGLADGGFAPKLTVL